MKVKGLKMILVLFKCICFPSNLYFLLLSSKYSLTRGPNRVLTFLSSTFLQCQSHLRSSGRCSPRPRSQAGQFASQHRWAAFLSLKCSGTKILRFCPRATSASSSMMKMSIRCCCLKSSLKMQASIAVRPKTTMERWRALHLSLWKVHMECFSAL